MMPLAKSHRFRSIVCAVDLSRYSAAALRYASALAASAGGSLTAVVAVDPVLSAAAAVAYASPIVERDAARELSRFVRATLGDAEGSRTACVARVGPARAAVLKEAHRLHADIVVIGTSGRRRATKLFFGSTTEAVLRRFRGAVLVVPPHCRAPRGGWPGTSIVAAIGEDRHRRAEIGAAARMAEHFGAWLSIVPADLASATRPGRAGLIIYPLPRAGRLRTFQQGSSAYRFICGSRAPVLVIRAARRGTTLRPLARRVA
jgi:nucleotide-binding universal stress UspA family protein